MLSNKVYITCLAEISSYSALLLSRRYYLTYHSLWRSTVVLTDLAEADTQIPQRRVIIEKNWACSSP
jgi:hypothetical protein